MPDPVSGTASGTAWDITTASGSDAVVIARLADELGYPESASTIGKRLEQLLALPRIHRVVVARATGGELAGWAAAERRIGLEFPERVELMGLVVGSAFRRVGVASALLAAVEAWAAALPVETVFLRSNVVRDAAHRFYPARGYVLTKTQHVYVKRLPACDPR